MPIIRILSKELAEKIAAGEVIERPASVVKELVENSLDAGAKNIRVAVEDAGRKKILVADDGSGMSREELALAVLRHATSKLRTEEDLFRIATLGFRGEALPSIGAVSHLILESKPREGDSAEGSRLEMRGGEMSPPEAAGCPAGTRMEVRDLFYNTPARLKFLKSDPVERGHIENTLLQLAVGRPECRFVFTADGRERFNCPATGEPRERLRDALGSSWAEEGIPLEADNPEIGVKGWLLPPGQTASNANNIYFYLNGRFLKDRLLQHALIAGFGDFLMKGRFPKGVLFLRIDPGQVDVNVHPSKREVRFCSPNPVHEYIRKTVRAVLQKKVYSEGTAQETVRPEFIEGQEWRTGVIPPSPQPPPARGGEDFLAHPPPAEGDFFSSPSPLAGEGWGGGVFSSLQVLGILSRTYLLCESPRGELVLIDQHAAHEWIGYVRLKENWERGGEGVQRLLLPITWETDVGSVALLQGHLPLLQKAGLEMDLFGETTFIVKAVPALLDEKQIPRLLEKLVQELAETETASAVEKAKEHLLKTMSCHLQVRAGDVLSREETEYLLREMDTFRATHCPHGRPTFTVIDPDQIRKWFKRIV